MEVMESEMKILIACEFSGVVRDAFTERGHDVMSCDLLPTEQPGQHYQGDVFDIIDDGWDMMIAHPECTFLCVTGNKWMKDEFKDRFPTRQQDRKNAIKFFMDLVSAPIDKIAIENPVGIMSTQYKKPTQYVHPYFFGDPHSKKTGLWLKNLDKLIPTDMVEPRMYTYQDGRKDPIWHVESMKMPKEERTKFRSKTFKGIADAMASQWG